MYSDIMIGLFNIILAFTYWLDSKVDFNLALLIVV